MAVESFAWHAIAAGLGVTVSIGVTAQEEGHVSQAALLGHADRNLYAAKNAGRNRVVYDLA